MNRSTATLAVAAMVVLCLSGRAMADAEGDYQELFAQQEKAALAKGAIGMAEFAAKLVDAARQVGDQKDLQILLCEKAYAFGMKAPPGYQAACEALKILMTAAPGRKTEVRQKLLDLAQLRYNHSAKNSRVQAGRELAEMLVESGDEQASAGKLAEAVAMYRRALALGPALEPARAEEIGGKLKRIASLQESEKQFSGLKAKLDRDPKNVELRAMLIMACLGQFDKPAEAVKFLTPELDETLRTYVPLAAKKVDALPKASCLELAQWYRAVADKAPTADKGVFIDKAIECCARYLKLSKANDADLPKAKALLEAIGKDMMASRPREMTLALGKGVTMKLVLIPPGTFLMGSPTSEKSRIPNEGPQHEVTISRPFYMGVYEVTLAQYEAVMAKSNPYTNYFGLNGAMPQATWAEAMAFCAAMSKKTGKTARLPTEAEWEYACRAGTTTAYNTGDTLTTDQACFRPSIRPTGSTEEKRGEMDVGRYKPNAWGLYDMHGNASEWCLDWCGNYRKNSEVDPVGDVSGEYHAIRGGNRYWQAHECRSAIRYKEQASSRGSCNGLRVVVPVR